MVTDRNQYKTGRLTARPATHSGKADVTTGVQSLRLDKKRDGFIYVPRHYKANKPAALAVMLHGAGGSAEQGLSLLRHYADTKNIILLAPLAQSYS